MLRKPHEPLDWSAERTDLTLFLPGEGGISPLIVCHVTKLVRNRVNLTT